uniref:Regulator of DNA class I crossover intermediates 1 n=2 Tax=Mus musculus TaxID=10090 RepID=RDIC1_MOUSE|nr:RecName: Full=Regulator of DNA class I crossover intermediates 1; AltName: Full=Protein CN725425 [Mus musculus]
MNWVGGSRSRVLIKQERRKQKEYFERNKLKSKLKLLGVVSPVKKPSVSLDLLNLYVVNQISSMKENSETMKRPTHVNMTRDLKVPLRKHDLELPMSPHCVPSKLCIDDMEDSVPYQRIYSKEETGPVQSSQDMKSYRMFNETGNCSYIPPSFPEELRSNRHIRSQHSTPRIGPSPQQFVYENPHSGQFSNGKFPESLFSKLNKHQHVFSSSQTTAEFEAPYKRTNSSETGDFLTKRSMIMGEDCRSLYERRQPDFAMEKPLVQQIYANNGEEFSNFLEDVIHPTQRHLPDNHNSFVSHSMIDLLSKDQPGRRATFTKCGYDSLSDTHVVSSDESHSSSGLINGEFTVPQATSPNFPFNTSYTETCQPNRPCQEYNSNEINEFRRSFEKDCYSIGCGRKGKIESDKQLKELQRNARKHPVYTMADIPLEELHCKQSCDFDQNEIPMERRGMCPLKGQPMSTEKIYLESSQSSQSASYSPRPTESTFSSSTDLISEDEDQIQQQTEDSNKKATETTGNCCLEKMENHFDDITVKDDATAHKQNHKCLQSSEKNNADAFPESQCNSEHTVQNKSTDNCVLQAGRCDVGVQTEEAPLVGNTADVAVQCTIITRCSCMSSPVLIREKESSHPEAGSCTEDRTADTTGGQETPTSNSL